MTPTQNPVVIVIDNDPAVRTSLQFSLEVEGFRVLAYADSIALLKEPELPVFGCLVIDYDLPKIDGLELLQELRKQGVLLPAILIASHPSLTLRSRAAAVGINVIEKPLFNDSLIDSVRDALARQQ